MALRGVLTLTLALLVVAAGEEESLCSKCGCGENIINCTGRGMEALPDQWPSNFNATSAFFDHNDIVHVEGFPPAPAMRLLSLRGNRIQKIEDAAFQNLTAVEEIDLSHNELSSAVMDGAIFRGLPGNKPGNLPLGNMTVLRLASNAIHTLPTEIFRMVEGLKTLTLAYNPLRVLDNPTIVALASLTKLEYLDLAYCELTSLPDDVVHTPQGLRVLNLTGNFFTAVPSALRLSRTIVELRLGETHIAEMNNASFPTALNTVRVLHLEYLANLTQVGAGTFGPLTNLTELYLEHCKHLKVIDPRAFTSAPNYNIHPPIKTLVLRGNALERLNEDLFRNHWEELKVLDLQYNQWNCDCDSQWMVDTLEGIINASRPDLLHNVICASPEAVRGKGLFDLHSRHVHLQCGGGGLSGATVAFIGVLVGILLAVPATLAGLLFWRRGGLPWFGSGPAAFSRAYYSRTDSVGDF